MLIAGRVQEAPLEAELRAVCAGAKNIELRLEYLSEAAYDEAIRQCRYCILNYSENYSLHSSGVVFDILFRGVPIVGSRCRDAANGGSKRIGQNGIQHGGFCAGKAAG